MVSRVNLHPYTVDDSDSEELLELLMLGLRTSDGEAKGVGQFHMAYMLIIDVNSLGKFHTSDHIRCL